MNDAAERVGDGFLYSAFLSYSPQDRSFAERLLKRLERYPLRRALDGTLEQAKTRPVRLTICRGSDKRAAGSELPEPVCQKLRQSRFLIVVCSPASARAARPDGARAEAGWIDEEIRYFQSLGRSEQILAVIKQGIPYASVADAPAPGVRREDECYPFALRWKVDASGCPTATKSEILAADAREEGDGFADATLKLIAALAGVPFASLKPREEKRRHDARLRLLAGASASVTVLLALAVSATWSGVLRAEAGARSTALPDIERAAVRRAERDYVTAAQLRARAGAESAQLHQVEQTVQDLAHGLAVTAHSSRASSFSRGAWNGSVLALGDAGGRLQGWRPTSDGTRWELAWLAEGRRSGGQPGVSDVTWSPGPEGGVFISVGENGSIRGWNDGDGSAAWTRDDADDAPAAHRFVTASARPGVRATDAYLAAGDADGGVWLLTRSNGRQAKRWQPHGALVRTVRWRPSGHQFCSASFDGTVQIWKHDGTPIRTLALPGRRDRLVTVQYSPDGRWLAAAGDSGVVGVWEVETGELRHQLKALEASQRDDGGVRTLSWLDSGQLLSGSADGRILQWDVRRGSMVRVLSENSVGAAALSDVTWVGPVTREHVAVAGPGGLRVIDSQTGRVTHSMDGPRSDATAVQVLAAHASHDGRYAATSSPDRDAAVRVFDLETLRIHRSFQASATGNDSAARRFVAPRPLALAPDGGRIAWGEPGGVIRIRVTGDGSLLQVIADAHPQAVSEGGDGRTAPLTSDTGITCLAWSSDGRLLASRGDDGTVRIWDTEHGFQKANELHDQPSRRSEGPIAPAPPGLTSAACMFLPGTDLLVTATQGNRIRVWNARHRTEPIRSLDELPAAAMITSIASSQDGHFLAAGTNSGAVALWRIHPDFELIRIIDLSQRTDTSTDDNQHETLVLGNDRRGAPEGQPFQRGVRQLAFSPGRTLLAVTTDDGALTVHDPQKGRILASTVVLEHHLPHSSARPFFSHSGRLVTLDSDGAFRQWDRGWPSRPSGELDFRYTVRSLSGAPNGSAWLAQVGPDNYAQAWTSDGRPMSGLNVRSTGPVSAAAWLDGGAGIALAGRGGAIIVLRRRGTAWLEERRIMPPEEAERRFQEYVHDVAFVAEAGRLLPDLRVSALEADASGTWLAVAWAGDAVWMLDLASWQWRAQRLAAVDGPPGLPLWVQLASRPGHRELAGLDGQGRVALWSTDDGRLRWNAQLSTSSLGDTPLAFSPDGRLLAISGNTDRVTIVDADTGSEMTTTPPHGTDEHGSRRVPSVKWLRGGALLATIAADRSVYLWRTQSLPGQRVRLAGLAPVHSWRAIAANSPDDATEEERAMALELLRDHDAPATVLLSLRAIAVSSDEHTVAVAHSDGVTLFDVDGLLDEVGQLETLPATELTRLLESRTGLRLLGSRAIPRADNSLVPASRLSDTTAAW